ncbi:class I SAM-dependent methyltransferase [Streptomyces sp. NBC_01497]|uniref:class I SAM-dependent methyltransferase n=1 Tax=Streptomyces sp. NBC_01497 TaxID=2903885 RepID=UPI002E3258B3|nr:class I SAM-dependent methyltransferase [Streptomyces sp. NBC_01497]
MIQEPGAHEPRTSTPQPPAHEDRAAPYDPLLYEAGHEAPADGDGEDEGSEPEAARRGAGEAESSRANRGWWDRNADEYQSEHGTFLGDDRFVWCPEGLDEMEAELLGPLESLSGLDVLEIGAGAAQCSRWLAAQGARPVALDLSHRQLQHGRRIDDERARPLALVQADAGVLPFRDGAFDLACSAYGAVPFVADSAKVFHEVHRVLRPGGRWVFSVTHPVRWAFPDEPGPEGLTATMPYFDRTPYVEQDEEGNAVYVEHHRTLGDRVRDLTASGFRLVDLVEPEWPAWNTQEWGGWSPLRGRLLPGTAIFVCVRD